MSNDWRIAERENCGCRLNLKAGILWTGQNGRKIVEKSCRINLSNRWFVERKNNNRLKLVCVDVLIQFDLQRQKKKVCLFPFEYSLADNIVSNRLDFIRIWALWFRFEFSSFFTFFFWQIKSFVVTNRRLYKSEQQKPCFCVWLEFNWMELAFEVNANNNAIEMNIAHRFKSMIM